MILDMPRFQRYRPVMPRRSSPPPGCLPYNVRLSAPEESAESVCMVRFSIAILMSRESIRRIR